MKKQTLSALVLLLVALIWGSAFVAQSKGMEHVGAFTYNGARSFLGGIVLLPVLPLLSKAGGSKAPRADEPSRKKATVTGGLCCGVVLFAASSLQQLGVSMTTAGKAGFITALYIVIVPILGIFLRRRIPAAVWLCVAAAVAGFYLLCVKEDFSVGRGDLLVLGCAFVFSVHIMTIDRFNAKGADAAKMSCIQFFTAGVLSLPLMFIFEEPSLSSLWDARLTIAYAGILSSGVAYTLQIFAQKHADPTTATLIMSLESVFAALSGWLILGETLSAKELCGCGVVFAAVVAAQLIAMRSNDG
ncbi:MAG: DMT family transporter [Ruminococcus sp.]|nr:DMT family transporter [Ruminococcus sp.]